MSRLTYGTFEALIVKYYEPTIELDVMVDILVPAAFTQKEFDDYIDSADHYLPSSVRSGKLNFTKKILYPYQHPDVRDKVIPYFRDNITAFIPIESRADLIRELVAIIKSDAYIADEQKEALLQLAKLETVTEFLTEAHIYAIKKKNIRPKDLTFPLNNLHRSYPKPILYWAWGLSETNSQDSTQGQKAMRSVRAWWHWQNTNRT